MPIAPTTAVPLADVQNICTFLGLDPADVTDFAAFDKAVQPFCYRGDGNGRLPEHTDLDDLLKTLNSSLSNISGWQGIASSAKAGGQSAVQKRKCLARVHFAPLTGDAVQNLSDAERHEETTWRGSKAGTSGPVGRKKKAVRTAISKFYPDIKFAEDGSVIQPPSGSSGGSSAGGNSGSSGSGTGSSSGNSGSSDPADSSSGTGGNSSSAGSSGGNRGSGGGDGGSGSPPSALDVTELTSENKHALTRLQHYFGDQGKDQKEMLALVQHFAPHAAPTQGAPQFSNCVVHAAYSVIQAFGRKQLSSACQNHVGWKAALDSIPLARTYDETGTEQLPEKLLFCTFDSDAYTLFGGDIRGSQVRELGIAVGAKGNPQSPTFLTSIEEVLGNWSDRAHEQCEAAEGSIKSKLSLLWNANLVDRPRSQFRDSNALADLGHRAGVDSTTCARLRERGISMASLQAASKPTDLTPLGRAEDASAISALFTASLTGAGAGFDAAKPKTEATLTDTSVFLAAKGGDGSALLRTANSIAAGPEAATWKLAAIARAAERNPHCLAMTLSDLPTSRLNSAWLALHHTIEGLIKECLVESDEWAVCQPVVPSQAVCAAIRTGNIGGIISSPTMIAVHTAVSPDGKGPTQGQCMDLDDTATASRTAAVFDMALEPLLGFTLRSAIVDPASRMYARGVPAPLVTMASAATVRAYSAALKRHRAQLSSADVGPHGSCWPSFCPLPPDITANHAAHMQHAAFANAHAASTPTKKRGRDGAHGGTGSTKVCHKFLEGKDCRFDCHFQHPDGKFGSKKHRPANQGGGNGNTGGGQHGNGGNGSGGNNNRNNGGGGGRGNGGGGNGNGSEPKFIDEASYTKFNVKTPEGFTSGTTTYRELWALAKAYNDSNNNCFWVTHAGSCRQKFCEQCK
jgi:hypothetical protein